jgi:hypothetical protein
MLLFFNFISVFCYWRAVKKGTGLKNVVRRRFELRSRFIEERQEQVQQVQQILGKCMAIRVICMNGLLVTSLAKIDDYTNHASVIMFSVLRHLCV